MDIEAMEAMGPRFPADMCGDGPEKQKCIGTEKPISAPKMTADSVAFHASSIMVAHALDFLFQ
jgi:hypothetical protein